MESLASKIIWSADVPDEETLMRYLCKMPDLEFVKIDRLFVEDRGLFIFERVADLGFRVFDDAKIVEIPHKAVGIAEKHLAHRPWMLNCMAGILSTGYVTHEDTNKIDALKRFADACHKVGTRPCGVTVLTSKTTGVVDSEFYGRTSVEQVLYYVGVLADAGFTDVVCSPLEMEAIRSEPDFDKIDTNTPGIVMSGADQRDQARTNTPGKAIAAGATRVVVGSALTKGDPTANFEAIMANIIESQV